MGRLALTSRRCVPSAELFGDVASDSTLYRTLTGADEGTLVESLAGAMATVRERVWADYPEDETVILDIDSSVHEIHSENKQHAAPTYNRKYGFHPMYCFADWTGGAARCSATARRRSP